MTKSFKIQLGKLELRSCDNDPFLMAEIVFHAPDRDHKIASYESQSESNLALKLDYELASEYDDFNEEDLSKLIDLLMSITQILLLSSDERLQIMGVDDFTDDQINNFLEDMEEDDFEEDL